MTTNPPSEQPDPTPENGSADYDIAPAYGQSHMHSTAPGGTPAVAPKKRSSKVALIIGAIVLGALLITGVVLSLFGLGKTTEVPAPAPAPTASETATPEPATAEPTMDATMEPTEEATAAATAEATIEAVPEERPVFDTPAEEDAYFAEKTRAVHAMPELTDEQMIGVAKKTCQRLDGGESVASIYEDILSLPAALMNDTSAAFGSGVSFYCPEYSDDFTAYMESPTAEINELSQVEVPAFG